MSSSATSRPEHGVAGRAGRLPVAVAAVVIAAIAMVGICGSWIRGQAFDHTVDRSGLSLHVVGWVSIAGAVALVLLAGDHVFVGRIATRRRFIMAAGVIGLPPAVCILAMEAAQSWLPNWVQAALDLGDFVSVSAGPCAWLTVVVGTIGASAVYLVSGLEHTASKGMWRAQPVSIARACLAVSVAAVAMLRALPWLSIQIVHDQSSIARQLPSGRASSLNFALSDIPGLGPTSLIAVLILIASATALLISPAEITTVIGGAVAGTICALSWACLAVVRGARTAIPDSWLRVDDGLRVASADVTAALWLTFAAGAVALFSIQAVFLMRPQRHTARSERTKGEAEYVYRYGGGGVGR